MSDVFKLHAVAMETKLDFLLWNYLDRAEYRYLTVHTSNSDKAHCNFHVMRNAVKYETSMRTNDTQSADVVNGTRIKKGT